MNMGRIPITGLLVVLTACLWWYWNTPTVIAQSDGVVWSEPVLLSNPEVNAWSPAMVVDMAGHVHIMWGQTMTEDPGPGESDTLFYTRWDGQQWSQKVDVLISPQGSSTNPELAVTPDGMLHAVWETGGEEAKVMYAYAPACCADDPKNWSLPVSLGSPVLDKVALVADGQGRLHVAFASFETKGIVYLRSDDSGATWPVWVDIPGGLRLNDEYAIYPRLAVDGRGRVHAVWSVEPWGGRSVIYAYSNDGGNTWSEPQIIDNFAFSNYEETYGPIFIDIEAVGDDEIHLIWDGAPTIERTHVWSADGGNTWSKPNNSLFPTVTGVGRSGFNDMALDSAGMLHTVSLHGNANSLHAEWNGGVWSTADQIPTQGPTEWNRIAISRGNNLHFVWNVKASKPFSVWYIQGQIKGAPELAVQVLPTPKPTPTSQSSIAPRTPEAPQLSATRTVQLLNENISSQPSLLTNPASGLMLGIVPVVFLIGLVFVINLKRVWWQQKDQ